MPPVERACTYDKSVREYDLVDDLVNPSSSTVGGLQNIVIDGIEEEYIRSHARSHPWSESEITLRLRVIALSG